MLSDCIVREQPCGVKTSLLRGVLGTDSRCLLADLAEQP